MFIKDDKMKPFESKIWLSSPTMHGEELKYMTEAFETNWIRDTLHDAISTSLEQRKEMGDISEQIAKKYLTYDRIQNAWRMLLL